jgi:hypothetical protein
MTILMPPNLDASIWDRDTSLLSDVQQAKLMTPLGECQPKFAVSWRQLDIFQFPFVGHFEGGGRKAGYLQ